MRRIIDDRRSAQRSPEDQRSPGTRKLTLQRQTLRELATPDLQVAVGGAGCSISNDETFI